MPGGCVTGGTFTRYGCIRERGGEMTSSSPVLNNNIHTKKNKV